MGKTSRTVTLMLTENCNLNCIYCYESHNKGKMSIETAIRIIQKEMKEIEDTELLIIDFFGGEPFLEFNNIKTIYNYIESNFKDKNWICFTTTNGTLVHDEVQDWLVKRKENFICGLSLDGTASMHNKNRNDSYEDIDWAFFKLMWPNQPIKMTVSNKTIDNLAEGVIHLHKLGFEVNCNLAYGIDWSNDRNSDILERELSILIDFYIENPQIKPCTMLSMGIQYLCYGDSDKVHKWCGVGTHMHTYDVKGNQYACQMFMPISIGCEKAVQAKCIEFKNEFMLTEIDEKCRECVIRPVCATCYGANFLQTGDIHKKDEYQCQLKKIMFMATSYLQYKKYINDQLNCTKEELYWILMGIEKVQTEL